MDTFRHDVVVRGDTTCHTDDEAADLVNTGVDALTAARTYFILNDTHPELRDAIGQAIAALAGTYKCPTCENGALLKACHTL